MGESTQMEEERQGGPRLQGTALPERTQGRVSLIMGAYNCADTVEEAVLSLLRQDYGDLEVVICEDGSTDGTWEVLQRLAREHPDEIILLKNDRNRRLAATLNRCLEHCTGQYVGRMDADDVSKPSRLREQVAYLRANPTVDLVGTGMERFGGPGEGSVVRPPRRPDKYSLRRGSPFCHATILTYPEVYGKLGGYSETTSTTRVEDIDLWYRFFRAEFVGHNLDTPLYLVRESDDALRRRTLRNRWNLMVTDYRGYRLLNYPRRWLAWPLVSFLKVLIPHPVMAAYRNRQANADRAEVI